MKYLVELKFTNPSHEHVSLRRRVETVTRIVEATNEDQALLRASQQQRALGFRIQEAKVVKEKSHEMSSEEETIVAKGEKIMKKDEDKDEEIEEAKGTASYPLLKPGQKLKPMKLKTEEVDGVEQVNEADREMNIARALVKQIGSDHDYDKRDKGYKMSPAVRAAQKKSDALSKVVKRPQAGTLAAAKMKEEVDQVDEGAIKNIKNMQAKWNTAHRAVYGKDPTKKSMLLGAAARLLGAKPHAARALSTTLAGKPVSAQQKAAAISRAGKKGMASMKKEEKEMDKSTHKTRKAAEKMIKKAKGRVNKINMAPEIEINKQEGK